VGSINGEVHDSAVNMERFGHEGAWDGHSTVAALESSADSLDFVQIETLWEVPLEDRTAGQTVDPFDVPAGKGDFGTEAGDAFGENGGDSGGESSGGESEGAEMMGSPQACSEIRAEATMEDRAPAGGVEMTPPHPAPSDKGAAETPSTDDDSSASSSPSSPSSSQGGMAVTLQMIASSAVEAAAMLSRGGGWDDTAATFAFFESVDV
jgi:hypothetical protein